MLAEIGFPGWSLYAFEWGGFGVRWYGLAYIVGLILGWRYVVALLRRPQLWPGDASPLAPQKADDLLMAIAIGVIVGGRLGFVLLYRPGDYLAEPLNILKTWEGGMSFHGGLLGVICAILIYAWRQRTSALSLGDAVACAVPIGLFFGRLANFTNAELYGRPTNAPWAMKFPTWSPEAKDWVYTGQEAARHPSQLYEAGLEGLALGLVLLLAWRAGALKRPGLCIGIFLTGYGLARAFIENFRQMDYFMPGDGYAVSFGGWGLTMGQVYSLPMIAAGLAFMIFSRRHEPARA